MRWRVRGDEKDLRLGGLIGIGWQSGRLGGGGASRGFVCVTESKRNRMDWNGVLPLVRFPRFLTIV